MASPPTPKEIISYGGGGWKDGQVNEPCLLANPKDATKLIMFYSGMKLGGSKGAIGKAWANISDPFTWHEDSDNPIFTGNPGMAFEASANNHKAQGHAIGLATCPAGKDGYSEIVAAGIKRYEGNPILSPNGQGRDDETHVSQGAVIRENGLWHCLYSYRTAKQVLPGIRLATSPDGRHWTKVPGSDLLAAAPESRYIEWHQVRKIGTRYVMFYEGYNGGTRWGADVAVSSSLTTGWKKAPVTLIDQSKWPNYSDKTLFHVATPAIYQLNGKWHLYFQAAPSGHYIVQHWTLWGMECDDVLQKISRLP